MAFKYGTRRTKTAKRARRNRNWKKLKQRKQVRNRTTVPVGLGFPKKMVMTHKYSEAIAQNTGALGALGIYNFSCNSLFDPNSTGTGHQPLYFDQMAAIYDHYTVIGSKAIIRVSKTDSSTNIPIIVGMYINDDTTATPSTQYSMIEQSSGKHKVINGNNPTTTFVGKWSAKKTFGGSVLGNDNLQGTAGASPTEQSYFTIFFDSTTNATQTSVMIDVEITYIAVWDELKDIASS